MLTGCVSGRNVNYETLGKIVVTLTEAKEGLEARLALVTEAMRRIAIVMNDAA